MAYVVTEACIRCKYTDCVEVCPVDCFHEGSQLLVIDPEACIDCALCESECPVDAIYPDDHVPADQLVFIDWNAQLARRWPVLAEPKDPPQDAGDWVGITGKRRFLAMDEVKARA